MSNKEFVIFVHNDDYEVSLEPRKVYEVLFDETSDKLDMIRVVDESGDDYLYPKDFFVSVSLSELAEKKLLLAA